MTAVIVVIVYCLLSLGLGLLIGGIVRLAELRRPRPAEIRDEDVPRPE